MAISSNKEYIMSALKRFNIEQDDVDLIMADHPELDSEGAVDAHACKVAIYQSMSSVLPAITSNVSEGGYSVSWNIEGVKMWYSSLCHELGMPDVLAKKKPSIRNRSNCW